MIKTDFSPEALEFGWKSGVREIVPLVQRVIDLEIALAALTTRIERLEADAKKHSPHLRGIENRA